MVPTFTNCIFAFQIIVCTFLPFLIFPLVYFVPDEQHERKAAAQRSQKSLTSKSMKSVRQNGKGEKDGGRGDGGVELQRIETVNGNAAATDEEATMGVDGEDIVDYIPG